MKKIILKDSIIFGLLAATCCILVALIQYYALHVNPFGRYSVPAYGINIIFIFLAIWYYRIQQGGYLSFGEGFIVGFLTNLIAAFLTGIALYIFVQFIDNKPLELWRLENIYTMDMMKEIHVKQFGEESYNKLLAGMKLPLSSITVFTDEMLKKQYCIVAVSLISVILRRHLPTNS